MSSARKEGGRGYKHLLHGRLEVGVVGGGEAQLVARHRRHLDGRERGHRRVVALGEQRVVAELVARLEPLDAHLLPLHIGAGEGAA